MEELLAYFTSYPATLRLLQRRTATAANAAEWQALRALFGENLDRMRAARRFYKYLRNAQGKARTEAHFRAHRANMACHRISLDTIHNRHREATNALLSLTNKKVKSASTPTR